MKLGCCSTESVCLKRLLRHITTIGITKGKRNAATGGNLGLRSHHRPSHQIDIYRLSRPINGTIGKDADILQRIFLHVIGKVSPSCIDRQSFVLRRTDTKLQFGIKIRLFITYIEKMVLITYGYDRFAVFVCHKTRITMAIIQFVIAH